MTWKISIVSNVFQPLKADLLAVFTVDVGNVLIFTDAIPFFFIFLPVSLLRGQGAEVIEKLGSGPHMMAPLKGCYLAQICTALSNRCLAVSGVHTRRCLCTICAQRKQPMSDFLSVIESTTLCMTRREAEGVPSAVFFVTFV